MFSSTSGLYSFSSVQFSHSVMSNSLRPHELQHARPPCPSPTPGVYPNSRPLSWWCHPTISSSVIPSPLAFNLSQHQGLFKSVSSLHQVAKPLEFQLQHQSFLCLHHFIYWNPSVLSLIFYFGAYFLLVFRKFSWKVMVLYVILILSFMESFEYYFKCFLSPHSVLWNFEYI